jgi:hypothetical protein
MTLAPSEAPAEAVCRNCEHGLGRDHGVSCDDVLFCSEECMWSIELEEPEAPGSVDDKGSEKQVESSPLASGTSSDTYYPSWEEVLKRQAARGRDGDAMHAMFQFHEAMLGFTVEETMHEDPELRRKDGKPENVVAGRPYPTRIFTPASLATPL